MEKLYIVKVNLINQVIATDWTIEQVEKFIANQASKMNYGLYRYWEHGDVKYYDCGPRTYVVTEQK